MEVTGSTNADALAWALEGAPEGAVIVADQQTEGRGRWGRSWQSTPGASLLFSVVIRPADRPAEVVSLLTTAVGVACARALEELTGLRPPLKWPNDLLIDGRKCGGILVESRAVDDGLVAVIGVGINVLTQAFPPEVEGTATTLQEWLGDDGAPQRQALLDVLLQAIGTEYRKLASRDGRSEVLAAAAALSDVIGRLVRVRFADGSSAEGLAKGLTSSGALELAVGDVVRRITSGEVEKLRVG